MLSWPLDIAVHQQWAAIQVGAQRGQDRTVSDQDAAGLKWTLEVQWDIIDRCLQMHGGYGFVNKHVRATASEFAGSAALRQNHRDHEGPDGTSHGVLAMTLITGWLRTRGSNRSFD